jgi:hypothetical protein
MEDHKQNIFKCDRLWRIRPQIYGGEEIMLPTTSSLIAMASSGGGGGKNVGHKTITENGYYYASDDGYDGYDIVTVQCPKDPINTTTATFTQNGTYTPPSGYDGYSSFTVAVSDVKPKVKLKAGTTYEQAQALACPLEDEIIQIDGIYYIQKL